jgi:hypothetical protein
MRPALTILSLLAIVAADAATAQTRTQREGASPQRTRPVAETAPARSRGPASRAQFPAGTIGPSTPNADGNFGGPGGGGGGGGP